MEIGKIMQDYTYHCHTNSLGIYDGTNSADEMISRAEELGFSEIGISNHLICHPSIGYINKLQNMYFRDYNTVEDLYKRTVDDVRAAAVKHKIKVWVGFEVDYFNDPEWLRFFERLRGRLDADYYIGSSHFIYNNDFSNIQKISYINKHPELLDDDIRVNGPKNHWKNIVAAINSGWFTFIAHLDQIVSKGVCLEPEWDEWKYRAVEALGKSKTGFELSTKGLRKGNEFFPVSWMVKELNRRNVPVVISDDAHSVAQLGENFTKAEDFLSSINYQNRLRL